MKMIKKLLVFMINSIEQTVWLVKKNKILKMPTKNTTIQSYLILKLKNKNKSNKPKPLYLKLKLNKKTNLFNKKTSKLSNTNKTSIKKMNILHVL